MHALIRLGVFTSILCAATALLAQTNSSLIVSVSDPNGNIVVGAATVITTDSGFKQNVTSSELGVASFRGIAAGSYKIVITVDGFKEFTSLAIAIKPGETKRLDVILELAQIESKVDVSEQDAVDPTKAGNTTDLKKQEIQNLPDDPEELKRVLKSMAGPTITGDEMEISVNGIPGATLPNKENIKLVRINRNVFSSQYEYSYGGGIEIYTDDDIKKISGNVGANFSDSRLNATSPYLGRRVPAQSKGFNYSISAPLGRKASFSWYSSYGWWNSSSVVNAVVLDQNFVPVDLRQSYETQSFNGWNSAYFNWDPNKKHKLVASLDFFHGNSDNGDIGGFSLESRANKSRNLNISFAMNETYIINPDFVNTTRLSIRQEHFSSKPLYSGAAINVSEAFLGGGSPTNSDVTNGRFELYNDTTKKFGRWNVGIGAMIRGYRNKDVSRSNFGGTYTFSGRNAPVLDANYQPVRDSSGNIVTSQVTSIETYRRTVLLRSLGYSPAQIRTLGGGADQFTISGGQPELSVNQYDYSIYEQNNFGLSPTMGVSFGLRYENQTNIENRTNVAPRLGFTWAPKAKEKQKPETTLPRITLGYGIFYNRFGISNVLSELQANSPDRAFYFITDPSILDRFPAVPSVSELQQGTTLRSLRLIDDELQTPLQKIFSFNLSKSLWFGSSINAGFTRVHTSRSALTRNINAPFAAPAGSTAPPVYPFGNSRNTYETRSEGRNRSDRIFVTANMPQWKLLGKPVFTNVWYSFAKVRNDIVPGSSSPLDPYDFSREWAPTTGDGVHQVNAYMNFSLPFMMFVRADINVRTGSRFNITTGRDTNRDGIYAERPAFASNPNKPGVVQTPYGLLDPNPTDADILIPRNLARGPGSTEANIYLTKMFGFNKDKAKKNEPRQRLNFSVWVSNVFNINNKGNPIGNLSSPNFLQTISTSRFDGEFRTSNPRSMRFSTSFSF